ncbi:putative secreted protein with PEP-CTERM sorting signal [Nitrosospira sp. Nsp5]|uniref:PEP-CTERM protein-sorting domain-containing protein n=1 Tax=Nitrosospira multiformis TaxID=1231 RepID=A0ABY0TDM2_9PROT|nr:MULTISPECIES: PEP-CTERM sorting domain-containing protein [Nitrosospira]PTR08939.1 putative secreted protein with PEP-CTERM sorting signal [Nitrosospira sp. Nsp5]SDQ67374.1 PEP-CTERM protein-sorting domain-containing protein [Nitrosospira multiformis]
MKLRTMSVIAGLLLASPALADITNGPDPYTAGFGFDKPDDATAAWGGWTRGDAGTAYAEWDTFSGAPGTPYSTVYGSSGVSNSTLTWNTVTFAASTSGNLYSFSGTQVYDIDITSSTAFSGPVTVALQFETWGTAMDYSSILLNGAAPTSGAVTYSDPAFSSSMGPVELNQYLAVWTLNSAPTNFHIDLQSAGPHQSFAQVAVDIAAPIPEPGEWAMLLAGLGLMGAIVRRRNAKSA